MKKQREGLYQRALAIRMQSLGQRHLETAQSVYTLAILQHKQGKLDEARSLAEQAHAICADLLGNAHAQTAMTLALVDRVLQRRAGRQNEAAALLHTEEIALSGKTCRVEETFPIFHEAADVPLSESGTFQELLAECCKLHPHVWCRRHEVKDG